MTFPQVGMSEEEKAKAREEFLQLAAENPVEEQPKPKRGRGRPPGSKNKPRPQDYAPYKSTSSETPSEDTEFPTLASPKLSTRDQKEVAERLAGILKAGTGVASVVRPYFLMTDDEADAIAIPLSTYLIRTEATSKTANQILEEYDLAAFALALMAYVVRVYLDFARERKELKEQRAEQPRNVTSSEPVETDDGRTFARTVGETIQQSPLQTQDGEERPVSRQLASASESGWVPSQV